MGIETSIIMDARRRRGNRERLYLLEEEKSDEKTVKYQVSGSTGRVYELCCKDGLGVISCTCPDKKMNGTPICKHMYFIMVKV
jgi:uncharacterized Zn finger protein